MKIHNPLPNRRQYIAVQLLLVALTSASAFSQTTVDVAGPATQLVVSETPYLMQPRWAPDSQSLVVTGSNYTGLWVINEDRSVREITSEPAAGFGASWSPDGNSILARVSEFDNRRRLNGIKVFYLDSSTPYVVAAPSTQVSQLPSWTRSGDVLWHDGTQARLSQVSEATSEAPIQSTLVTQSGRIVRLSLPDLEPATILQSSDDRILNLVESPDGTRAAFEVLGGNMFVVNADGSGIIDLGEGNRPRWSPDSQWVVYSISEDDGYRYTSSDLYVVRADGTQRQRITTTADALEMNPDWSPDGKRIAFDDRGKIYILELN